MNNREIANHFSLLAKLLELQDENPFKIKSYTNAYQNIRRMDKALAALTVEELTGLKGIGQAIANKTVELCTTGKMQALEDLKAKTPPGILEMLKIKGLGAKKVKLIWKGLGVETVGELHYACLENRLVSLKGFGLKTQQNIIAQLEFFQASKGSVLLSDAMVLTNQLLDSLKSEFNVSSFRVTGQVRRRMELIDRIEILGLIKSDEVINHLLKRKGFTIKENRYFYHGINLNYHFTEEKDFITRLYVTTGPESILKPENGINFKSEEEIFNQIGLSFLPPECRDQNEFKENPGNFNLDNILKQEDVKGVIHAHSNWSDGSNSIEELANFCRESGYTYLLITDHSKSAFYANGLREERLFKQWEEIGRVNEKMTNFKVFKGIESDILSNGSLDYTDDILRRFDVVIASVHSNLKMDEPTATKRLIKAIENQYTRILGHPTGRLLLSRPGYKPDFKKLIDACAANEVVIEINANPHRLDIDWRWVPYTLSKGVKLCISPDAHFKSGVHDIAYGVFMARKGGMQKQDCINTLNAAAFAKWAMEK